MSLLTGNGQVDGDHYKKHGDYQPWAVLKHWLSPEAFIGYMIGTTTVYIARWRDKGGLADLKKARHYLDALIEHLEEHQVLDIQIRAVGEERHR